MEFFKQKFPDSLHLKAPPAPPLRQRLQEATAKCASLDKQLEASVSKRSDLLAKAEQELANQTRIAVERAEWLHKSSAVQAEMQATSDQPEQVPINSSSIEGMQAIAEIMDPFNKIQQLEQQLAEQRKVFRDAHKVHESAVAAQAKSELAPAPALAGDGAPAPGAAAGAMEMAVDGGGPGAADASQEAAVLSTAAAMQEDKTESRKRLLEEAKIKGESDYQRLKTEQQPG